MNALINKTLYLVRHCQTTGQEPDAPLTEEGFQQAAALEIWLSTKPIKRIVSSPYTRAYQSIEPLARRLDLTIEMDDRLTERVLCATSLPDWPEHLAASFTDLDYCLPGGESSRAAMARGVATLDDILMNEVDTTVVVTHGNLMALLLKHFDDTWGFAQWQKLTNPDVYCLQYNGAPPHVTRVTQGIFSTG